MANTLTTTPQHILINVMLSCIDLIIGQNKRKLFDWLTNTLTKPHSNSNTHIKTPQTPHITNQLLADWSRGRASCAQSRRSTRLQAAADCSSGKTAWQTCQPPSKWDWRWPSLCQLDLERTGSVGEVLSDCAQGWAMRKQWWGDGAISTTLSRWIATTGSHGRWPTSSPATY